MKASRMTGVITAAVLASASALHAQGVGAPDMGPGGAQHPGAMPQQPNMMPPPAMGSGMGPGGCQGMGMPRPGQGIAGGQFMGTGIPDPESLRKAGATQQQVQAIEDLMFDQKVKSIDLRAAAEKAQMTLDHLMQAAKPDEKAIMQAVDAANQARGEIMKLEISIRLKVKQVLGDDIMGKLREQESSARRDRRPNAVGARRPAMPPGEPGAGKPSEQPK